MKNESRANYDSISSFRIDVIVSGGLPLVASLLLVRSTRCERIISQPPPESARRRSAVHLRLQPNRAEQRPHLQSM